VVWMGSDQAGPHFESYWTAWTVRSLALSTDQWSIDRVESTDQWRIDRVQSTDQWSGKDSLM